MKKIDHNEIFYESLSNITGIEINIIRKYANDNRVINIIERPDIINANESQEKKLSDLKELISLFSLMKEQQKTIVLNSAKASKAYFEGLLSLKKDKEQFVVAFLDTQNKLIESKVIAEGGIDKAYIPLRDILEAALKSKASAIVMAHNHPSGIPTPSKEDYELTKRVINALLPLDIRVLDHIVVGDRVSTSIAETRAVDFSRVTGIADYKPFFMGDSIDSKSKDACQIIEKMMEENYEAFIKGLIAAETGIEERRVLNKVYDHYVSEILERGDSSIIDKEVIKKAFNLEKMYQTVYIVSNENEKMAYHQFAKENGMDDIEIITKQSAKEFDFKDFKSATLALVKDDNPEELKNILNKHKISINIHSPLENSFAEDWMKQRSLMTENLVQENNEMLMD